MSRKRQLDLGIIASDNAKDLKQAREWFANASNEALLKVWLRIQADDKDDVAEIVSRLAQLKFGELMIEEMKRRGEDK